MSSNFTGSYSWLTALLASILSMAGSLLLLLHLRRGGRRIKLISRPRCRLRHTSSLPPCGLGTAKNGYQPAFHSWQGACLATSTTLKGLKAAELRKNVWPWQARCRRNCGGRREADLALPLLSSVFSAFSMLCICSIKMGLALPSVSYPQFCSSARRTFTCRVAHPPLATFQRCTSCMFVRNQYLRLKDLCKQANLAIVSL